MDPFSQSVVRAAYDAVAEDYDRAFGDELADLPIDRAMLDAALVTAESGGWVLELGCGPAPAASYFSDRVERLVGLDLSRAMLAAARRRNPQAHLTQADMRHLPLRDTSCALVIAFYSTQHLPRAQLPLALAEIHRVLDQRGVLLISTHLGEGDLYIEEFLGHQIVPTGGSLYSPEEFKKRVTEAGFGIEHAQQRGPLSHEHDTQRLYLLARALE